MGLAAGDRLGPYDITAPIGVGGMGEVYRARDSRLDRDVAIKIAAEQFSDRFEREARAVAALNHPNICTLYDVGPNYLVMEYVEGETLHGPLPLPEALRVARQIGDALDEAHSKGIVHRDLKPGNIKIKPDGSIKVLDFGLAKIGGTPAVSSQDSPTISLAATQAGVILGTAAYMSPEQARGKIVDARSDIWSFGVVLYELITGESLFGGDDLTDTLAAVVRKEPDWERVPFEVRRLLKACLERDPKQRLRHIADAWRLLDEAPSSAISPAPPRSRLNIPIAAAALVFALAAAGLAFVHFRETSPEPPVVRLEIHAPPGTELSNFPPAVSPDGRTVAFVARGEDTKTRIWLRPIDALDAHVLRGTEDVRLPGPFWSPDSRFLGFVTDSLNATGGVLTKIDVSGGPPLALGDVTGIGGLAGGSWGNDGVILLGSPRGVLRIAQTGGEDRLVTKTDPPGELTHGFPHFLPDGRRFLFLANRSVFVSTLDGGPRRKLADGVSRSQYAAPAREGQPGHLLYVRDGTLMAQPVDPESLDPAGDVFPIAEDVNAGFGGAIADFSVSSTGTLAYRIGRVSGGLSLTWLDRDGKAVGTIGSPGNYVEVSLSRAGTRAAVTLMDGLSPDVWISDGHGVLSRFTSSPGAEFSPVWAPDDRRLAFAVAASANGAAHGSIMAVDAGGQDQEQPVVKQGRIRDWSSDGRYVLYDDRDSNGRFRFIVASLEGDRPSVTYALDRFNLAQGQFAPPVGDPTAPPRWIAYVSNEAGPNEIYVQSFPPSGRGIRVSSGGGLEPRWRRDGKELFYISPSGSVMAVEMTLAPSLTVGRTTELFKSAITSGGPRAFSFHYDVTPDGKRFLLITKPQEATTAPPPITVVVNWQSAVGAR